MSAEPTDFDSARDAVLDAYAGGDYGLCLELALLARDGFPGHRARTTYWVACMRSMTGSPKAALDELTAGLDRGDWWSAEWLTTDPDLEAARELPDFDDVVRRADAAFETRGVVEQRPPIVELPAAEPTVVLVALHGGSSTADATAPGWRSCVARGAALVVPESPYRATPDDDEGRSWPTPERSAGIVADALRSAAPPSGTPAIVGGFSQGARLAAGMALTRTVAEWRGAILFGPPPPLMASGVEEPPFARRPRFWIFVGEEDGACYEPARRFATELAAVGVATELETRPGFGHDYPPDIDERLGRALAFVLR